MDKSCIVIVLDGLGIGETEDVGQVRPQDRGANTLRSIIDHAKELRIPNLTKLGLLKTLTYEQQTENAENMENTENTERTENAENQGRDTSILTIADGYIGRIMDKMKAEDLLMIIADHGNDPLIGHSKHTREYVPLLIYGKSLTGTGRIPQQDTLANVGATVCSFFGCELPMFGKAIIL